MTLQLLVIGLGIWLAFLVACLIGAWVWLAHHPDSRLVHVLPIVMVLIAVSLILFFVLRGLFGV